MGRYYNGDINGKFWFGVQSSDDAEQFGATTGEQGYIPYYVEELEPVKERLEEIFEELGITPVYYDLEGSNREEEDFYDAYAKYRAEKPGDATEKLWASLDIGLRIFHCVRKEGTCSFEAEI